MSYISGFVVAVPTANKEACRAHAAKAVELFKEYGVVKMMEAWGVDVPDGKVTDLKRAVQAKDDETIVFSLMVWPDKATADAGEKKMFEDERMKAMMTMLFDGKRMIFGGFTPIFELGR
jgi:uncharacterized protein YbaA (DUF1428 family)